VILAHNHPSGNTEPSNEDDAITQRLMDAGQIVGIPVLDPRDRRVHRVLQLPRKRQAIGRSGGKEVRHTGDSVVIRLKQQNYYISVNRKCVIAKEIRDYFVKRVYISLPCVIL